MIERGSDKHSSRVDEVLKHDTRSIVQGAPVESRAQEAREQEGPADGDPSPDARLTGEREPVDDTRLTSDEVEARSELARHVEPSVFPAGREALLASARRLHAPDDVIDRLSRLPDGSFENLEAVWEALGGKRDRRA